MTAPASQKQRGNAQGMGLHIMSYRAGMIGGRLEVESDIRYGNLCDLHLSDGVPSEEDNRMSTLTTPDRAAQSTKKNVLVVDDHPLLRQGLALLINQQQDMQVCGEAEEAQAAMQAIAQSRPDIMILDISLNGPDGLELLKSIRASDPDLPVLILSMHDEAIYAERALRARANGYIMKQEATEKVLVAVRRILNGERLPQRPHVE